MVLGRLLRHRTVIFLLVAGAAWAAWTAFLDVTAPGRIDPTLRASLGHGAPVNVAVTLNFPPEDFHIRLFQDYGVVSGVQGSTIQVNRIRPADVRRIARFYWVRRIAPQAKNGRGA